MKMQSPLLMEEVRIFDKTILSDTPVLKRNLQPVSAFQAQYYFNIIYSLNMEKSYKQMEKM